jgi:hypothetical protein
LVFTDFSGLSSSLEDASSDLITDFFVLSSKKKSF